MGKNEYKNLINDYLKSIEKQITKIEKQNAELKSNPSVNNLKKAIAEVNSYTKKDDKSFEEIRNKIFLLQERSKQCMREVIFENSYDTGSVDNISTNARKANTIKDAGKKAFFTLNNNVLAVTEKMVDRFDEFYPEYKAAEVEKADAEKRQAYEQEQRYFKAIDHYKTYFKENFVPNIQDANKNYKEASQKFHKMMRRFNKENVSIHEAQDYKNEMKAVRVPLEKYAWEILEKNGFPVPGKADPSEEIKDILNEKQHVNLLKGIQNEKERTCYDNTIKILIGIKACDREIDRGAQLGPCAKTFGEWSQGAEDIFRYSEVVSSGLKHKDTTVLTMEEPHEKNLHKAEWYENKKRTQEELKKLRGDGRSNSKEYNHMMKVYDEVVTGIKTVKNPEEARQEMNRLKEAASHYVRCKLAQKGLDTTDILDNQNTSKMLGLKSMPKIHSEIGRRRYEFAKSIVTSIQGLEAALYYHERYAEAEKYREEQKNKDHSPDMDERNMEDTFEM